MGSLTENALKSFRAVAALAPDRVDNRFYLGAACLKEHQVQEALQTWSKATEIDRQYFPARLPWAFCCWTRGQYEEARPNLELALQLRPHDGDAQFEVGRLYFHEQQLARALAALQKADRLNPGSKQTSFFQAKTYQRLGRAGEAAREFSRAKKLYSAENSGDYPVDAAKDNHRNLP
jgi:tetratricopeptide (TPR) repeat protein